MRGFGLDICLVVLVVCDGFVYFNVVVGVGGGVGVVNLCVVFCVGVLVVDVKLGQVFFGVVVS